MKIFQIFKGICYYDTTPVHPTLESTEGKYPPDVLFVEAPDYVFEGWGFDPTKEGDERFIKPTPPEGWFYDEATGTFYSQEKVITDQIVELKQNLSSTDYLAIKYAEGLLLETEYAPIKAQRQAWRDEINELEAQLN